MLPPDRGGDGRRRPFDWRGLFQLAWSAFMVGVMFTALVNRAREIRERFERWGER